MAASNNRFLITDLSIDAIDKKSLVKSLVDMAKSDLQSTVGYLNIHVANCATVYPEVKTFINDMCNVVYCDGRGIAWGARLAGLPPIPRQTVADWLPEILRKFRDEGLRVYLVAGKPGVAQRAVATMGFQSGDRETIREHHGYMQNGQSEQVLREIREFSPDVVIVGMGTPPQEQWVLENRENIKAPLVWVIGAAFDYYANEQERGPEIFRNLGHEWLGRLWVDPRRLWKRYLIGNPKFLVRVIKKRLFTRRSF